MIIFDREQYLDDIKKNGIGATDPYANQKLQTIIYEFVQNSTYKKSKIIDKILNIANDYFCGLPDNLARIEVEELYQAAKVRAEKAIEEESKKEITLYKSEMEVIANLENENIRKLAFAALIVHKFVGQYKDGGEICYHSYIKCCEKDIYRIAKMKNVSGATKNKLWQELVNMGLVNLRVNTNSAYRFNSSWTAIPIFTVTFNKNIAKEKTNEEIYMQVSNYDDIMLYLRYYLGDNAVTLCKGCRCPIERDNGKQYCQICAGNRKKTSDKQRYEKGKIRKSA